MDRVRRQQRTTGEEECSRPRIVRQKRLLKYLTTHHFLLNILNYLVRPKPLYQVKYAGEGSEKIVQSALPKMAILTFWHQINVTTTFLKSLSLSTVVPLHDTVRMSRKLTGTYELKHPIRE